MLRTFVLLLGFLSAVGAQAPRTWLGVGLVDVPKELAAELQIPDGEGALIAQVVQGGPADRASLRPGEVILRYNDQAVTSLPELGGWVRESVAGQMIPLILVSTQGKRTVNVRIEERQRAAPPKPPSIAEAEPLDFDIPRPLMVVRNRSLGATLEPLEGQLAEFFGVRAGVLVREVFAGSAAEQAGLRAGDVIVEANEQEVRHPNQLRQALHQRTAQSVQIRVLRDRKSRVIEIRIDSSNPFGRPFTQRFQQR